jgi:C4-type Zn-finger protein
MKCPICKGSGEIPDSRKRVPKAIDNAIMSGLLRDAGYSIREIMKFLGYKSPRSVALCLERADRIKGRR